jgi:uroporphyrinogen decarboxylase
MLKPRDRVLRTLNHQEPDRVPTALGGGPYGVVDELYLKLIQMCKLGDPVPPFRVGHSISYMDDRLLDHLNTDFRYCWPGLLPNSPIYHGKEENTFFDSFGQSWKHATPYFYTGNGLLQEANTIDDIDKMVDWPDINNPVWIEGILDRAKMLKENSDFFVVMRMAASHGPFQTACDLRGTENFYLDMAMNPDFALALVEKITCFLSGLYRRIMQNAGLFFDMIELPGDDYAGNENLIISPRMFRKFIKPSLQRLIVTIKEINPNVKIMFHSDGAITSLISDFIELGIDVLHPLEPLLVTDHKLIKNEFGKSISFLGGIDITSAMLGSEADVIHEVKQRIHQLAHGGGYILAPSNHLQSDIPPKNVLTLFRFAEKIGQYPLKPELLSQYTNKRK